MKLTPEEIKAKVLELSGRKVLSISNPVTELIAISTDGEPESDSKSYSGNQCFFGDIEIISHNMPINIVIQGLTSPIINQDAEIASQKLELQLVKSVSLDKGTHDGKGVSVEMIGVVLDLKPLPLFNAGDRVTIPGALSENAFGIVTEVTDTDDSYKYTLEVHYAEDTRLLLIRDVPEEFLTVSSEN